MPVKFSHRLHKSENVIIRGVAWFYPVQSCPACVCSA